MDACTKRLLSWILIELAGMTMFIACIVIKVMTGEPFDEGDKIYTSIILSVCVCIIIVTVILCRKSQADEIADTEKHRLDVTDYDKISQKMKPVDREFGSDCAICLLPKESHSTPVVQLSCQHDYHSKCIKDCFQKTRDLRCPQCRQIVQNVSSKQIHQKKQNFSSPLRLITFIHHFRKSNKDNALESGQANAEEV